MRAVEWVDGRVRFIDQTKLPVHEVYVETDDCRVVGEAIRTLQIRGAPAIGVAAAFGALLAVTASPARSVPDLLVHLASAVGYLSSTRPTAVNLFAALRRMTSAAANSFADTPEGFRGDLLREALAIQREDSEACRRIGDYGAPLLPQGSAVLTHCNTGALATAGEGTALSVIVTAARQGKVTRVYADETRPLFQGARLTTWELLHHGIPVVLITDSMAATVLRQGKAQTVIVGADRIAANGDTANKVGTYSLALVARAHNVPFYVAAPVSTIDLETATGEGIRIEERDARELTHINGVPIAPAGVEVFNPAFDVTPATLITAVITDRGIARAPYEASLASILAAEGR